MKIHPVGSELFQADRRTTQNYDAFRNLENAPKSCCTSAPNLATVIILCTFWSQWNTNSNQMPQI